MKFSVNFGGRQNLLGEKHTLLASMPINPWLQKGNLLNLHVYMYTVHLLLLFVLPVIVTFPLDEDPSVSVIAWTTTPWTLPSNLALCVHPDFTYVKVKGADITFP